MVEAQVVRITETVLGVRITGYESGMVQYVPVPRAAIRVPGNGETRDAVTGTISQASCAREDVLLSGGSALESAEEVGGLP